MLASVDSVRPRARARWIAPVLAPAPEGPAAKRCAALECGWTLCWMLSSPSNSCLLLTSLVTERSPCLASLAKPGRSCAPSFSRSPSRSNYRTVEDPRSASPKRYGGLGPDARHRVDLAFALTRASAGRTSKRDPEQSPGMRPIWLACVHRTGGSLPSRATAARFRTPRLSLAGLGQWPATSLARRDVTSRWGSAS